MKKKNTKQRSPRFAHFTDLHVGMGTQKWLWPTFKSALISDLKSQIEKFGDLDFVIFTGDLTQKGSSSEFSRLNDILKEVWEVFRQYGSNPLFLPIPGNHDLVRSKDIDPTVLALEQWWEKNEIQSAFWAEKPKVYRNCVAKSFQNYKKWFAGLPSIGIPIPEIKEGVLPGDFSAELNIHGVSIGIVGLNSAWLQLTSKNYDKKLCVDPRQMMAVTEHDPDGWCSRHDFNFLATHHPETWLHPNSLSAWRSEIYVSSRFDAHYFGHMHAANTTSVSEGGSASRRNIQGASLFGLEFIDAKVQRLHGYGLYEAISLDSKKCLKEWPRFAHKTSAGAYRLIANPEFECDDDGAIDHHMNNDVSKQAIDISTDFQTFGPRANTGLLKRIRKLQPDSLVIPDIRYIERAKSVESLRDNRALWMVVDWGMGIESFLKQLSDSLGVDQENVFVLDLQNCSCLADIYVEIDSKLNANFGDLLDALAEQSTSVLLLDDAPIYEGKDKIGRQLQSDVEKFISAALDYCPDLHVIATSRLKPI
ncbi:metallophosphoesterase, partial [Pseudomonas sp. MD195_PC81_125]|uniref:metallophosphoesterase family protein n=1 Tax=Pseudomonas sp. MD195_PC81_125 TaxID=2741560 RepID=UPI0015FDBB21